MTFLNENLAILFHFVFDLGLDEVDSVCNGFGLLVLKELDSVPNGFRLQIFYFGIFPS